MLLALLVYSFSFRLGEKKEGRDQGIGSDDEPHLLGIILPLDSALLNWSSQRGRGMAVCRASQHTLRYEILHHVVWSN